MQPQNHRLSFGTGGIRAVMGEAPNQMNALTVQRATLALANYLKKVGKPPFSVAISYDTRHQSQEFAQMAAETLLAQEIAVFLTEQCRPTPFISYLCREKTCSAAIMITASHNAKEYNGYKVYWSDGAQVVPPHDRGIIAMFDEAQKLDSIPTRPMDPNVDESFDLRYLKAMHQTACIPEQNKKFGARLNVYYTSLHGCGITLAEKAFKMWGFTHYKTVDEQCTLDGDFPTVRSPNPEDPAAAELGIEHLLAKQGDLLLINDPDADRLSAAVISKKRAYILSGNQIAVLLLHHILQHKTLPKNSAVAASIVTTPLLKKMCDAHHIHFCQTLTGFKYIAEKINEWEATEKFEFIFGAEQSYGYLAGDYVRDKDGIAAAMLLCEAALDCKLKGKTLLDTLKEIEAEFGIYCSKERSVTGDDTLTQTLRENPPKNLAGYAVIKTIDYLDGVDHLPKANVLSYHLEGGHVLIIRPSGTEPKVKLYAMTQGKNGTKLLDPLLHALI